MGRTLREPPADWATDADGDADPVDVAKQIILRQLTHSPKTRHQLTAVLAKRDVPTWAAEQALDRITELGYIDDAAFARAWVESRHRSKGLSERVLRRELKERGIANETADTVLAEYVDRDSEYAAARSLVEKKVRSMGGVDEDVATRRLVGMLGRKGYAPGVAFAVVRDVLNPTALG